MGFTSPLSSSLAGVGHRKTSSLLTRYPLIPAPLQSLRCLHALIKCI